MLQRLRECSQINCLVSDSGFTIYSCDIWENYLISLFLNFIIYILKSYLRLYTYKRVNFTLCKLSLNIPDLKKPLKKYTSFDSMTLLQETICKKYSETHIAVFLLTVTKQEPGGDPTTREQLRQLRSLLTATRHCVHKKYEIVNI